MTLFLFALAAAFLPARVSALSVSGTVVDADGQPLPGAIVAVYDATGKNLSHTMTDIDGKYTVEAAKEDRLEFSYLGFQKQTLPVSGRTRLDVALSPDVSTELDKVVVIGYGEVRRADLTGSVTNVRMGDIEAGAVTSVDAALQGRVAGADVMTTTGEPGATSSIRIRGTRSILASNEPLIVVDGVMDAVHDISDVNPSDIESISVLKDASSTAIYGSRGANGVILITTKSARSEKDVKMNVTLEATAGFNQLPRKLDVMNASEFAIYRNEYKINSISSYASSPSSQMPVPDILSYGKGTDWQDEIMRTAPYQNYYISTFGTPRKGTYFHISANYNGNQGIIKKSGQDKYTFAFNFSQELFKWLTIRYKINYNYVHQDKNLVTLGGNNPSFAAIYLSPLIAPGDNFNPIYSNGAYINTPTALLDQNIYYDKSHRATQTLGLDGKWGDHWSATAQLTYYFYERDRYRYYPSTLPKKSEDEGGEALRGKAGEKSFNFEASVTYKNDWNKTHHLDAVAVFNAYNYDRNEYQVSGAGYIVDNIKWDQLGAVVDKNTYSVTASGSEKTKLSFVARVNYNWKQRYYVTLNGRLDGASNFAENRKWGFFPSAAFKWTISNEPWMRAARQVDELSLRLSVGQTGNDAVSPYLSRAALASSTSGYLFNGQQPVAYYPSRFDNPDLTWETTTSYNLAAKGVFFNNRISAELEGYYSRTTDLLMSVASGRVTGYSSRYANLGVTSNAGVEFSLDTRNIVTKDFTWSTTFTISHNKQTVVDIGTNEYVPTYNAPASGGNTYMLYGYVKGRPLNSIWGLRYAGVWHNQEEIERNKITHAYGGTVAEQTPGFARYYDINHDGQIDQNDLCYLGNADPFLFGGFQNTFRYKRLKLNVFFQYSLGGKIFNYYELFMAGGQYTNQYRYMLNAWSPTRNPDSNLPRAGYYSVAAASDFMVHDASFFRLQTLSLEYNIPLPKKTILKDIVVSVVADNVFLLKNYNGYDPDVSTQSSSATLRRMDIGAYPKPRRVIFRIKIRY